MISRGYRLVLVQTGELFSLLVVLFDLPADPGLADCHARGSPDGGVDEEVGVLVVVASAGELLLVRGVADQQLVFEAVGRFLPGDLDPEQGPVVVPQALGSLSAGAAFPLVTAFRVGQQVVGTLDLPPAGGGLAGRAGERLADWDREHVVRGSALIALTVNM